MATLISSHTISDANTYCVLGHPMALESDRHMDTYMIQGINVYLN